MDGALATQILKLVEAVFERVVPDGADDLIGAAQERKGSGRKPRRRGIATLTRQETTMPELEAQWGFIFISYGSTQQVCWTTNSVASLRAVEAVEAEPPGRRSSLSKEGRAGSRKEPRGIKSSGRAEEGRQRTTDLCEVTARPHVVNPVQLKGILHCHGHLQEGGCWYQEMQEGGLAEPEGGRNCRACDRKRTQSGGKGGRGGDQGRRGVKQKRRCRAGEGRAVDPGKDKGGGKGRRGSCRGRCPRLDEACEGQGAHDGEAERKGKGGRLLGDPGKVAPEQRPDEDDVDAREAADALRGPVVLRGGVKKGDGGVEKRVGETRWSADGRGNEHSMLPPLPRPLPTPPPPFPPPLVRYKQQQQRSHLDVHDLLDVPHEERVVLVDAGGLVGGEPVVLRRSFESSAAAFFERWRMRKGW